jgi:DNA polymerase alpha subunit A
LLNDAPIQRPAAQRSLSWQSKVANSYLLRQSIVRSSESNSSSFALKNYSQGEEVDYNVDYGGDMYGIDQSMSTDDYHNQHSADENVVHRDEEYTLEKHSSVPVVSPSAPSQEAVPVVQKISLSKTTKTLKLDDGPLAGSHRNTDSTSFHSISTDYTDSMAGLTEIGSSNTLESSHTTMDFKSWLRKSTPVEGLGDAGEEYVDMYWLDACENNGIIYLFGKVPLQEPNSKSGQPVARFVSCCVVVHGLERNLFVLPKVMPNDSYDKDGKPCRMSMSEVYKEINSIMVPEIVPRMQGQSFRVKSVKRRYAFECGSVPRETLDYMKVVYSAKHGVPTQAQRQGGKTYEKIFGASSSCIELFLLKRKLMGPCWIRIKNPKSSSEVTSWCRIEVAVENPKFIVKVPQDEVTPIPLLTSMCLSMKTAVNPATHVHEIIALSALIHTKVDSEAETEVNFSAMRRFTYVRQLGLSCGSGYPSVFPHDVNSELKKFTASVGAKAESIQTMPNERAMISLFLSRLQQEDPDILSSHNLCGFEFDVLLARAVANKLPNWSLLGRKKRMKPPKNSYEKFIPSGRILCDTYRAAKEFLRETTYSLTHLAQSQLGVDRLEIDPIDVPKYFSDSRDIIKLCNHTFNDAILVQRLMLKLQVVPLTKQLTTLSGNLWSHTIRGARAERIEYLLLHEFHSMKFILPEPKEFEGKKSTVNRPNAAIEDENGEELEGKVGGMSRNKAKAAYAGGLVLEPKKGLYDTFILLLDFNSLYPSIIQEYNLCFTTVDWTKFMPELVKKTTASAEKPKSSKVSKKAKGKGKSTTPEPDATENVEIEDEEEGLADADDVEEESGGKLLPPIPDTSVEAGILPRVIKTLVERRKAVKALLKTAKDAATKQQYDIRQKALKLTANSMYGCLGFSFSRFYARPIAALITAMGREALQRTVDLATNQLGLDVIYGDTDSVMINTSLTDIAKVREIGNTVKREVNKLYKSLELDLDGIFKSMLLLKKKKYAAVVINELPDGTLAFEKEMKG